jgi:hypothetical protein
MRGKGGEERAEIGIRTDALICRTLQKEVTKVLNTRVIKTRPNGCKGGVH